MKRTLKWGFFRKAAEVQRTLAFFMPVRELMNPNRSLETELALFLMTAIRKMWLYIVGS